MLKNNRILNGRHDFTLSVNGLPVDLGRKLIRISEGDRLIFSIRIYGDEIDVKDVLLHTNITEGRWQYIKFASTAVQGIYELRMTAATGGRSAFRYAVETDVCLFWEAGDYKQLLIDPSVMDGLRMYTLIPKATGEIDEWIAKLDEIKAMGFNTVHILPVTKSGRSGSPYSAADLFSLDEAYGDGMAEFSRFCTAAASHGIMICHDIVLNHVGSDNIICREHADWIVADKNRDDGFKRAGYYHNNEWFFWEDLVLLNYDHPESAVRMQIYEYMLRYILFWLDASGDGKHMIRLDNLHSSNENFIKWLIPEVRKKYPEIVILSEYFGAEYHIDEAVIKYGLNLVTANSWEFPFAPALERYVSGLHSPDSMARYIITPVSHDTESAARLFGGPGSTVPRYAVCALMGTGKTGIVQGFEIGVAERLPFIGKERIAISETGYDFRDFISSVNKLIENESCLRYKSNIEFYDTGNDSLIVCRRRDKRGGGIIVAVNLDTVNSHSVNYRLAGHADTLLTEKAGAEYVLDENLIKINLQACGVCALRITR